MMGKHFSIFISLVLLFAGLLSCTPDVTVQKHQEEAIRNIGEAYMAEGNYSAALKELLRGEKLYPDDAYLQNDLGLVYLAKKKPDLAIPHFKKAVALNPDFAPAKNNLGKTYLDLKRWDEAIACFQELTKDLIYATPHYPLLNLGKAYYAKKNYALAEKYYKQALDISPNFPNALLGLGRTYLQQRRLPEAVALLEKVHSAYPKIAEIAFDLAYAYVLSRQHEKAIGVYRQIISLSPDSPLAQKAKTEIEKINALK